jgi:(p)ppGpp synthase/HD superfamily hydrolase
MKNRLIENLVYEHPNLAPVYNYGKRKHDATGAIRKNSGAPYWVHPEMVADVVEAYGGTEDEIAAALLHDTLEDTDTTAEDLEANFGPNVAQIVEEVTNFESEVKRLGKEQYINKELLELSDSALFVKIADCYCNYWDHPKPGQKERLIRNLKYLIEFRGKENIPRKCKRLLKGIPELDEYLDILDTNEFEDSFDELSDF